MVLTILKIISTNIIDNKYELSEITTRICSENNLGLADSIILNF